MKKKNGALKIRKILKSVLWLKQRGKEKTSAKSPKVAVHQAIATAILVPGHQGPIFKMMGLKQ